jgi:hypothetical protein
MHDSSVRQEDEMTTKFGFITRFVILTAALAVAVGCGGKADKGKVKTGTPDQEPGQVSSKPFVAPEIGGSGGGGGSVGPLSADDEAIVIPGSELGGAPAVIPPPAPKKGKKGAVPDLPAGYIPFSEGIAEQMEGLQWGMSHKKVMSLFEKRIRDTYSEELKTAAGDALAEDGVRTKLLRDVSKMQKSYIEFTGQTTGFESHMIADEFTHNNNESMFVWDAGKYVEYMFFINGRFWKRLRAFRKDSFKADITFMDFLGTIEGRFGLPGREFFDDKGNLDRVSWRNDDTYADILDRSGFFGAYGLRFSCAVTATYIKKLRVNADRDKGIVTDKVSDVVDEVTSVKGEIKDSEASVIDNYTGTKIGDGSTAVDATHSVTADKKKKGGKEPKKDEPAPAPTPAPAPKEDKPADSMDSLF